MRYKLGRIGVSEAVFAASASICINGITAIEPHFAYSKGNSTFISIPAACLCSLGIFMLLCNAVRLTGSADINDLFRYAFGKVFSCVASLLVCAALLICACIPLGNFTHVLDDLIYEGVEYPDLLAFILPAAGFIALCGLETIGRVSKIYGWILAAAVAAAAIVSLPKQHIYRLYPLFGDGAVHMFAHTASSTVCFLPGLAALTSFGSGMQGMKHVKKAGIRAALISSAVCFGVHTMLACLYTYEGLSSIFMPLFRLNYLGVERSYVMWLDKLLVMVWLNGGIISTAYCVYSAALIYSKAFSFHDVTPAVVLMLTLVCVLMLMEFIFGIKTAAYINDTAVNFGALFAVLPIVSACLIGSIKSKKHKAVKKAKAI